MPEQPTISHSHTKLFTWLGLLVLGLVIIATVAGVQLMRPAASLGEQIRTGDAVRPTFSGDMQEKVRASSGFNALVSYTDRGFEPSSVRMKAEETVRFTNNSSKNLMLRVGNDSYVLSPQDFIEHSFAADGDYTFSDGALIGTVSVN
ncbi:MAG: hypothetical protein WA021_01065 [Minisyncoccia bacterium]